LPPETGWPGVTVEVLVVVLVVDVVVVVVVVLVVDVVLVVVVDVVLVVVEVLLQPASIMEATIIRVRIMNSSFFIVFPLPPLIVHEAWVSHFFYHYIDSPPGEYCVLSMY